jgi:RNA polymerase sigma-70 factor (ECF subfamily)
VLQRELPISQPDQDDLLGALVGRAKQGSAAAFAELAARIQAQVRRWALRVTHDKDDADDVAQLVLLRLHLRLREFEGRSRFTTWLYRMTRNVALNRRRIERRRAGLLHAIPPSPATVMPDIAGQSDDDRLAVLVRSLSRELSRREREVFELADLQGMSAPDIATLLGLQPVSVRAALSRARRRIRLRMLEQYPYLLEEYDA